MSQLRFVSRVGLSLVGLTAVMAFVGCSSNTNAPTSTDCGSYTIPASGSTAAVTRSPMLNDDGNCVYNTTFVDSVAPLTEDVTLPNLVDSGLHIFEGSLVVGANYETSAALDAAGIAEGGDGPTLTVDAGATVAFANAADRVVINRGARIMAVGTALDPITFTSTADAEALASAVTTDDLAATVTDQWKGIIINGLGLTNACTYAAPADDTAGNVPPRRPLATDNAFMLAADQPTLAFPENGGCNRSSAIGNHGGTNPGDHSGSLDYVILKHVGDEDADNALALNAVGSATSLSNIEIFAAEGNGISVVGGGADLTNVLVYNAEVDGINLTDGYLGTLTTILVSQVDGQGERCVHVESGTGGQSDAQIADGMNTRAVIEGLTCDISADNERGSGVILEEGAQVLLRNSMIIGSRVAANADEANDNACLDVADERSIIRVEGVIVACKEAPENATLANFGLDTGVAARVIAEDGETDAQVAESIQFVAIPGDTLDPTTTTNTDFMVLSAGAGTEDDRALFSALLNDLVIAGVAETVEAASDGRNAPIFLGAISTGTNPFSGWSFGVFISQ